MSDPTTRLHDAITWRDCAVCREVEVVPPSPQGALAAALLGSTGRFAYLAGKISDRESAEAFEKKQLDLHRQQADEVIAALEAAGWTLQQAGSPTAADSPLRAALERLVQTVQRDAGTFPWNADIEQALEQARAVVREGEGLAPHDCVAAEAEIERLTALVKDGEA